MQEMEMETLYTSNTHSAFLILLLNPTISENMTVKKSFSFPVDNPLTN